MQRGIEFYKQFMSETGGVYHFHNVMPHVECAKWRVCFAGHEHFDQQKIIDRIWLLLCMCYDYTLATYGPQFNPDNIHYVCANEKTPPTITASWGFSYINIFRLVVEITPDNFKYKLATSHMDFKSPLGHVLSTDLGFAETIKNIEDSAKLRELVNSLNDNNKNQLANIYTAKKINAQQTEEIEALKKENQKLRLVARQHEETVKLLSNLRNAICERDEDTVTELLLKLTG